MVKIKKNDLYMYILTVIRCLHDTMSNFNTVEELRRIPKDTILVNNSKENQRMLAKELGLERSLVMYSHGIYHVVEGLQAIFLCKHNGTIYRFQFSSRDNDEMYKALFNLTF